MDLSPEVIDRAIHSAPAAVQEHIQEGVLADRVIEIGQEFSLHIDMIGRLAELSRNMLIGLSSPSEVLGELVIGGIDAETAKRILEALNQKIFIPIREEIRNPKPKEDDEQQLTNDMPLEPSMVVVSPIPEVALNSVRPTILSSIPGPALVPPMAMVREVAPPPAPVHVVVPPPMPAPVITPVVPQAPVVPAPLPVVPAPVPQAPTAPEVPLYDEHPQVRTMASDMQAAKEHHMPEALFARPLPAPFSPHPSAPPAPVAVAPLPPPVTTQPAGPAIAPVAPRTPPPPPSNLPGAPILKQYASDPYREPME